MLKKLEVNNMDKCPKCKSNWIGEEIPYSMRLFYGGTHWRREIGIDGGMLGIYDGIIAYKCPDCKEEFPRSNAPWALEMFEKYKEMTKDNPVKLGMITD
jgi:phage FluMu protein Com